MKRASPDVYVHIRAYVVAALGHLAGLVKRDADAFMGSPWPYWHRDADGNYRSSGQRYVWHPRIDEELNALPEFGRAVASLEADPVISPQLNRIAGTAAGGSILEPAGLLGNAVHASFREETGFAFLPDAYNRWYAETELWLHATRIEVPVVTLLGGIHGDAPLPISLGPEVELDRLSEAEVIRALSVDAITSIGGLLFANEPPVWGVRVRLPLTKLVGDLESSTPSELAELTTFWQHAAELTEQAVAALRLHKSGPITPLATLTLHAGPGLGVSTSVQLLAPGRLNFPTYELSADDGSTLAALAVDLQREGVLKRQYVGNALRRFSYASDRSRADDRILDLIISAESLFLGHLQDWHGELSFRLALHAAFFLGSLPSERRAIRTLFKRAYATRSAIVHRGAAAPSAWGSSSAHPQTLAAFTSEVEGAMRRALLKAVEIAKGRPTGGALVDWNSLVFRDSE